MPAEPPPSATGGRPTVWLLLPVLLWAAVAIWHSIKPMPDGTHVSSLPARLSAAQVDFLASDIDPSTLLQRDLAVIGRAEQSIVLDESPLPRALAESLLARKRQRPNLVIALVTDPRNEAYGGTPAAVLGTLERAGVIVTRVTLERLRDPNPGYSSLWRLGVSWWSNAFDEDSGRLGVAAALRDRNGKADQRHVLVADDGSGGWTSILASGSASSATAVAIEVRGQLARDIVTSELQIAAWSAADDRLPPAPPLENRGVGTIDARFLTEGATRTALRDVFGAAGAGDSLEVIVPALEDSAVVDALGQAAVRGAHVQLLLDGSRPATRAAAAGLVAQGAGNLEVRWREASPTATRYALIRHRNDAWIELGSADFTRLGLDDLNLEANLELHMPAHAAAVQNAAALFTRSWGHARPSTGQPGG